MKKILYILAFVGVAVASCDPLEETFEELDAISNPDQVGEVEVTMTDDDYDEIDNELVAANKGFADLDQAKELLPALLASKFPGLGKQSTGIVNYGFFKGFPAASVPFDENYEVTEEDYEAQGGNVAKFGNFSSLEQIVAFLNTQFPTPADGFLVELEYVFFDGNSPRDRVGYFRYTASDWTEESFELNEKYTVTEEDYEAQGGNVANFGNFSDQEQINTFLNSKFTNAVQHTVVKLTYDFFDGQVNELTNVFQFDGASTWTLKDGALISIDDYEAMGENFPNFSDQEEAENKLPIYLKNTFDQFAVEGDVHEFIYEVFNSSLTGSNRTEYTYVHLVFDGSQWNLSRDVLPTTLSFAHDGTKWVPDNTVNYDFVSADFDLIVEELTGADGFENQVGNLDNFGNFNRTGGSSSWSDAQLLEAINIVLLANFPDAEIGQKYNASFATFNSGVVVESKKVVLNDSGRYEFFDESAN